MPTNSEDNKGGDLAEITDLLGRKPKGTLTSRRNMPGDKGRTLANKVRFTNNSRGRFSDEAAMIKPTSQLNTPSGLNTRIGNSGTKIDPRYLTGRGLAMVTRKANTETAGALGTRGETKSAIGANKLPDEGRGLASAVREINSDDSRVISEPALKTATKALQGQREINLRTKAASALKGGGTALGLGSSIMGAEDAKDQYGAMQTGPNYMDLQTGKVKKRSGGGLTSS